MDSGSNPSTMRPFLRLKTRGARSDHTTSKKDASSVAHRLPSVTCGSRTRSSSAALGLYACTQLLCSFSHTPYPTLQGGDGSGSGPMSAPYSSRSSYSATSRCTPDHRHEDLQQERRRRLIRLTGNPISKAQGAGCKEVVAFYALIYI